MHISDALGREIYEHFQKNTPIKSRSSKNKCKSLFGVLALILFCVLSRMWHLTQKRFLGSGRLYAMHICKKKNNHKQKGLRKRKNNNNRHKRIEFIMFPEKWNANRCGFISIRDGRNSKPIKNISRLLFKKV